MMISLVSVISLHAQTETFDIASFIAPKGWQRLDSNGKLGFFDAKEMNGATKFCQILLYPSHATSGNPLNDFTNEWNSHIPKAKGYTKKPKVQTKKSSDGWDVTTGYANITQAGGTYTCTLTTFSGFGKTMSVLTNVAGLDYADDIQTFFEHLDLRAPILTGPTWNGSDKVPETGPASLKNYIYTAPQGWTAIQYPDGIVLSSPGSNTGERCNLSLWPMRQASGNLQNDAINLFNEVFKTFVPAQSSTSPSMIKGISPQGWDYFIIKQGIKMPGGDYQTMFGFAFVAKLDNTIAAISGISKDPLISSCFGLMLTDVWPKFFYSLNFKNWFPPAQPTPITPLMEKIPGVWMAVTGTAGDRFAFAPNGRFAGAAAAQKYYAISSNELLTVTDAYFGDGAYQINGNGIVLFHDSDKNNPEAGLLRIEQESKDGGRTWTEKLYLLRKSVVDGAEYEVVYDKQ